jgi:hypothetical protein
MGSYLAIFLMSLLLREENVANTSWHIRDPTQLAESKMGFSSAKFRCSCGVA